jgi:PKD repeat protein
LKPQYIGLQLLPIHNTQFSLNTHRKSDALSFEKAGTTLSFWSQICKDRLMKHITKITRIVLCWLLFATTLIFVPRTQAFQENWQSAPVGTYVPTSHDNLPLPLIPADEGHWLLGDTVSEFAECGSTPHTAEILSSGDNKSLRLTSNDSSSSCADNVWVNLIEVDELGLNTGFGVPLTAGTLISFEETGNLSNPQTGSSNCVNRPCGDTVSLTLEDNRGNTLAYVLQRAPAAVPNSRSGYREVFLDPSAGVFSRNLFADFSMIPGFIAYGATIKAVEFEVDAHGSATIDNICIGTSGCVLPAKIPVPDVVGLTQDEAEAAIAAEDLRVGTITWMMSLTVPAGSVSIQYPEAGTEVDPGTRVNLVISTGVPETGAYFNAYPKSGVAPLTVYFDEWSTGQVTAWEWDFGDGSTSTVQEPSYTYTRPGTYSVSLSVTGPYGSDTEVKTDFIYVDIPKANEYKIFPSDGEMGDAFGESVALFGSYAIVGAPNVGENGTGAAYVFEKTGDSWNEVAKLTASDGRQLNFFGRSVSISDEYAVVSAPGNQSRIGAVYIYEKNSPSWNQIAKLTASDGYTNDNFGYGVSISGNSIIVGAPGYYYSYGAAYIFENNGSSWDEVAKLTADPRRVYDEFGHSVALSGDYAIVGSYGDGYRIGAAYIFENNGSSWNPVAKLYASDKAGGDAFGQSVSIAGGYAIVGAYGDNRSRGAAYIFARSDSGWNEAAKLTASDGAESDYFSYYGVSISGESAIVSAYMDDHNGQYTGSAYLFKNIAGRWRQTDKLTAGGGVARDKFGHGVSISGGYALVGIPGDDYNGGSGAASIFDLSIPSNSYGADAAPWIPLLLLGE